MGYGMSISYTARTRGMDWIPRRSRFGTIELCTPRLLLRELDTTDLDAVMAYRCNPTVKRFDRDPKADHPTKVRGRLLQASADRWGVPRVDFNLAVVTRKSGRLIGDCSALRHKPIRPHGNDRLHDPPRLVGRGLRNGSR